jgi:hypothetical protein
MATAIRFQLDENIDHAVARGLRLRGIDVTTASDAGLIGAADVMHIEFAVANGRALVTHDPDFLALHAQGVEHRGLVFVARHATPVGGIVRFLCLLHECVSAEEMRGQVEYA